MTAFTKLTPEICGAGWCATGHCGWLRQTTAETKNIVGETESVRLGNMKQVFRIPVKDFGRANLTSRRIMVAVELALRDTGIEHSIATGGAVGIAATGLLGAFPDNAAYFANYTEFGRNMSRSSLFLYTLPTSPIAATAIHFGFRGPLYFLDLKPPRLHRLVEKVSSEVKPDSADAMIAVEWDDHAAVALAIGSIGENAGPGGKPPFFDTCCAAPDASPQSLATQFRTHALAMGDT